MRSPEFNHQKYGSYIGRPAGEAARQVRRAQLKEVCNKITLTDLFSIPIGPRQEFINAMVETRAESDGFVLQSADPKNPVRYRTKQDGDRRILPAEPTRVTVTEGLIIFGKYGLYADNEMEAPERAGLVIEVGATPEMKEQSADEKIAQAEAMMQAAQALIEEAKAAKKDAVAEKKEAAAESKKGRGKKDDQGSAES